MTEIKNRSIDDTGQSDAQFQPLNETVPKKAAVDVVEIEPTLVGYFMEKRASPSAYVKVLRKNDVKQFLQSDRDAVETIMMREDPNGERLWALLAHSSLPDSVDMWIWGATLFRLKKQFGDTLDLGEHNTKRILQKILRELGPILASENTEEKKRAETWLRLCVCWLMQKRNLGAWQVTEELQSALNVSSNLAEEVIKRGKSRELRIALAVTRLGEDLVKAAEEDRDTARNTANDLRDRFDTARREIEKLKSELISARKSIGEHEKRISELDQILYNERQHWGHNVTEIKAEQSMLLADRLGPLLEDAVDALEIEPPVPGIALRRLKSAVSMIKRQGNE